MPDANPANPEDCPPAGARPPSGNVAEGTSTERALACLRTGDAAGALAILVAVSTNSRDANREAALGMICLADGDGAGARAALRDAVALGDASIATALNLALAEASAGDRAKARRMIGDVIARAPDWDEPHLRLAELSRDEEQPESAEAAYRDALDRNPSRPEALLGLATLLIQRDRPTAAHLLLLRCCSSAETRADAWGALGQALLAAGEFSEAEAACEEAQRLAPRILAHALRRIEVGLLAGTTDAELARLEDHAARDPFDIVSLAARGVLLDRLGRRDEAIDVLEAATALAPDDPGPAIELANILIHTDRAAAAEAALARAIELSPEQWLLRNNRAVILMRLQRFREAREELETLLEAHGEQPGLFCNLSNVLTTLGEQENGVGAARRATEIAPDMHLPWRSLANALAYENGTTAAQMRAVSARAAETIVRPPPIAIAQARARGPDRRLRVGLLSTTLRAHPVGWLTIAGFENLDPAAHELICCAQRESNDPLARRFRAVASEWHVIEGLGLDAIGTKLRALDLDILIELSGYGDRGVMATVAQRLAPVQVKWVGMQNHSSGIPEMDWFITDRWETPAGYERLYSERLLRLPDGYVCYSPPAYAPDVAPQPAQRNGWVTFGCFNNLAKVTPDAIAAWSDILRTVPSARFVLKTHQLGDAATRERLTAAFAAHGVETGRIELRRSSPHRALLAQYNDIDIVLDPFPYTGGLTTCEALWMGVPTVTLAGELFSSRHATSHLCNVGLDDWVTTTRADYVAMAIARAADVAGLAALRAGLRGRMKASPLCDGVRFGRSLGAALRHAWSASCAA